MGPLLSLTPVKLGLVQPSKTPLNLCCEIPSGHSPRALSALPPAPAPPRGPGGGGGGVRAGPGGGSSSFFFSFHNIFTEISFTYHQIHTIQVYQSVFF